MPPEDVRGVALIVNRVITIQQNATRLKENNVENMKMIDGTSNHSVIAPNHLAKGHFAGHTGHAGSSWIGEAKYLRSSVA